jgi:putative transposase
LFEIIFKIEIMSHVRIWVHAVFATKYRTPFLSDEIRKSVFNHIIKNCNKKGILIRNINGYVDHAHCLIALGKDQTISNVMNQIKGESSHWINQNKMVSEKFMWQDDYYAVSVCESQLERVAAYINNQEKHHAKRSFDDELEELIRKYGFEKGE